MTAEIVTLKARLEEAETARHRLMTGVLEVTVSIGAYGSATYTQVDYDKLEKYIAALKFDIAKLDGRARRGPLLMRF